MYRELNHFNDFLFGLYRAAMSLEETVVSLKLHSGKRFDDILIKHTERSLAEFLDETLKELEVSETCKVFGLPVDKGSSLDLISLKRSQTLLEGEQVIHSLRTHSINHCVSCIIDNL